MKLGQKGFGTIEILLVILIVAVIGAAGAIVYTNNKNSDDKKSDSKEIKTTSQQNTGSKDASNENQTTEEQILAAVKCDTTDTSIVCDIKATTSKLAWVTVGDDHGGATYYLAKESGKWSVIYSGNGDVPQETVDKYSIPATWLGPQMDEVQ